MLHNLSAIALREKFLKGEVSATTITEAFLSRINQYNPQIKAFLSIFHEKALDKARKLDHKRELGQPLGHLAAIPIGIKDNIHCMGELTTCGSKFLENYKAPFESTVTKLIEEADGIILGKTNMDEFAMGSSTENSYFHPTYNPWDLTKTPGGSSGGSAAAVAARLCPLALGSDTGGSIRQPASFCNVVGFKPTYGRVSRYGLVAFSSSMDQIGPIATTTPDAALLMEVIGQPCQMDSTSIQDPAEHYLGLLKSDLSGIKIGVPWEFLEGLEAEPKEIFMNSLSNLQHLGATLVSVDLSILKYSLSVYYILATAEASTNLARYDGIRFGHRSEKAKTLDEIYDFSKEEGFGAEVKRRILLGTFVLSAGYQDAYYKKAQKVRTLIMQSYHNAFNNCSLIATPVTPFAPFALGSKKDPLQMYLEDIYTIGINLAGLPAISIPGGFTKNNLPLGLQLIGPQKGDGIVLAAANAYEKATSFTSRMPYT